MIAIVDYGMGNLFSIQNMLKKVGNTDVTISSEREIVNHASGIILPGVGAFDMGMSALRDKRLDECIISKANSGTPVLGICLGMQLLGKSSEEGITAGLGLIDFSCKKFSFSDSNLKVPHMGWDYVKVERPCILSESLPKEQRFYFVHSYWAECANSEDIFMSCTYGNTFAAAVCKKNVFGVQFHPEKSHKYGMALLKNFSEVCKNV